MIESGNFEGYRVERMLGRGGMGVVYEAIQTSLERRVALKVLRPELAEDPAFAERLRREGRIQASLEHPHVLDVYEVGDSQDGLFISMRLVQGVTLADLLRTGQLDGQRALSLLEQIGDALDAAHAAGLVHRDVKPQNVLVEDDYAFLADFGLTRAGTDATTATSRLMLGTVAYVAPEVVSGDEPSPESDRYSFAATLFHCLAGDFVYPRGSDAAVLFAHTSEPPPRISDRRPELPQALDRLFTQALAKNPGDRPRSARDLVLAVRKSLGENLVAGLGPPLPARGQQPTPITVPSQGLPRAQQVHDKRRTLVALAGVALAGVLAGLGAGVLLDSEAKPAPPEVPVPPLEPGATALGSDLTLPTRSLDCRGREPEGSSPSCAVVQQELPGAQLLVPEDGVITGWAVRGASGEMALGVIRPGGDDTIRIALSDRESVGNEAPHYFETEIPVEQGDLVDVELSPGATIGVLETEGATTQRWLKPEGGFFGRPDRGAGTGFDYELALRADLVPGAKPEVPEQLLGKAAARAPDGVVRKSADVDISTPADTVTIELVEVKGKVYLDLLNDGRRRARIGVPGLLPGGQLVGLELLPLDGEPFSAVGVSWINPNSGRLLVLGYSAYRNRFLFVAS
jgi:serine/threonine kinase PknH